MMLIRFDWGRTNQNVTIFVDKIDRTLKKYIFFTFYKIFFYSTIFIKYTDIRLLTRHYRDGANLH